MKKRAAALPFALALAFAMQAGALALGGIFGPRNFADAKKSYGFLHDDALIAYNGEISDQDFDGIYTGSVIYVPIGIRDEDGNVTLATDKDIKTDKVEASWKVTRGPRYIRNVSVADGKKEKLEGLDAGAYAKVELTDSFNSAGSAGVEVKVVLSVNNISYQETEIEIAFTMTNRNVIIDSNTVYGARVPTTFEADEDYSGQATFDMGGNVKYTSNVKAGEKYVIDYSTEPDGRIKELFPDAYLEFYDFRGENDRFLSIGRLEIPLGKNFSAQSGAPKAYVYTLPDGYALEPGSYAVDGDKLIIQTQSLGSYLVSDVDLREGYEAPSEEPVPARPASQSASAPPAEPQAPPMGGGAPPPTQPQTAEPAPAEPAPDAREPDVSQAVYYAGGINAVNAAAANPLTGAPPYFPAAAALAAALSLACLGKPGKKE